MKFGERLRQLREEKGLSQEQLGKILHQRKSNISKYENGKLEPSLNTIKAIADFFNVSLDYLFGRSDDPKNILIAEQNDAAKRIEKLSEKKKNLVESILSLVEALDESSAANDSGEGKRGAV